MALSSTVGAQVKVGTPFLWGVRTDVPIDLGTVVDVSLGWHCAIGRRHDGTVVAWGTGELAANVPAGLSDVIKVSNRDGHALALTAAGEIVAWGDNTFGQCGVPPQLSVAIDIAAGYNHSLGIDSHGTVYGWGLNTSGEATPPATVGPCYKVAAGESHSAALRWNGSIVCWGSNLGGPCNVPSNLGSCTKVVLGNHHTVALKSNGTVVCWGWDDYGQCSPPPNLGPCIDVAAGAFHTIALKADGTVVGWGFDQFGQASALSTGGPYFAIATAPFDHSCALRDRGAFNKDRVNLDKRSDIVFHQKALKQASVWFMNGLVKDGGGPLSLAPTSTQWSPQGLGDFNGDGYGDILWRTASGELRIWLMKGQQVVKSSAIIGATPLLKAVTVLAIGDINGDRMADIVVRNGPTGKVSAWLMNCVTRTDGDVIGESANLEFIGNGDFDGDGNVDLAFRSAAGAVQTWILDGFSKVAGPVQNSQPVPSQWQVHATGDLDGDGKDDLVWRHVGAGTVNGWLMDGAAKKSGGEMGKIGLEWSLIASADLNGDGKRDLVWTNANTNEVNGWLMNGLVKTAGGTMGTFSAGWKIVNR